MIYFGKLTEESHSVDVDDLLLFLFLHVFGVTSDFFRFVFFIYL